MTISVELLTVVIYLATFLVALAPVVLLGLWLRDLKKRNVW
jgi:hypothetical protein